MKSERQIKQSSRSVWALIKSIFGPIYSETITMKNKYFSSRSIYSYFSIKNEKSTPCKKVDQKKNPISSLKPHVLF